MAHRSRPVMVVGGLLVLVTLVAWVSNRDTAPPTAVPVTAASTVSVGPTSTPIGTAAPRSDRTVADSYPHTVILPVVVDGAAVLEMTDGTFTFEVIGHGEETVRVLPETLDEGGRYYRLNHYRQGAAISVEESVDGVAWEALLPIPEEVENPGLIDSPTGPVLLSYGRDESQRAGEFWRFWRWRDGVWVRLDGIPVDAGFAIGPIVRAASGDEILVTAGDGPLTGMARAELGCPGVQGVRSTEFGLAVIVVDTCGVLAVGTLSLVGSGGGAVAVLTDDSGTVLWRSAPGVERQFEQLLAFALSAGPESPSDADHIIFAGGQQRFWTSTDGIRFELASTLDVSPWAIEPAVLNGEVIVVRPEITPLATAGGEWRIGEASVVRVLTSPDARTWADAGLDVVLKTGEPIGQMAVAGARERALVTILDRGFVGTPGQWEELESLESWDWFQTFGDQWLAYDYGRELVLGVSSDGATWDSFVPSQLIGALDCGTEFLDWRLVGDELWFSSWDGRGVCIVRGRFTPAP